MPGKSFREQRVRAGIRANLADNFNVIYQEDGLTSHSTAAIAQTIH
jgi:hypothetical protein